MTLKPVVNKWDDLKVGLSARIPFTITAADMDVFCRLTGEHSRVHHDDEFARRNGFKERVVYGGLTIAWLSHMLGMHLPGDLGLSLSWKIDFNSPLYIDEEAVLEANLVHVSESTRSIKLNYKVTAGDRLIATGTAASKVLEE